MKSRAQITIEFMVIMGFAFLTLVSLLTIVSYHLRTSVSEALATGVEDIVTTVDVELTTARIIGEGYTTTFSLPYRVQGLAYTIQLQTTANESVVNITAGSAYADKQVPPCTGSLAPGPNTIHVTGGVLTCTPGAAS